MSSTNEAPDIYARVQRLGAASARKSAERTASNRERFPIHAAVADEFRRVAAEMGFDSLSKGLRWGRVWDERGEWTRPGYVDPGPGVPLSDWPPKRVKGRK